MIIKCDASQLEWRVKAWFAQDQIAMKEIQEVQDGIRASFHDLNKEEFGLPSKLIAKKFIYRMIFADAFGPRGYGGPAWAYAHDGDFAPTSTSPKYWERVVEKFFDKYKGILKHSKDMIHEGTTTGRIVAPTGRYYKYEPKMVKGEIKWPISDMLNWEVQGFAGDIMALARIAFRHRLPSLGFGSRALAINTVHDDVEADVDNEPEIVYNVCSLLQKCFRDMPVLFERAYGIHMNVPMDGEASFGWNLKDLETFNPQTFKEDYKKVYAS